MLLRSFVWLGLAMAGCTYTFNPSSIPGHIKTLEIPVAENQTLEVALAEELTGALTERFVQDNSLRVVQEDTDALLECQITGYEKRVFGFDANEVANEYIVIMNLNMTLRDRVKSKEIWSETGVQGRASYALNGSDEGVTTEEEARGLAVKQIVDLALAKTVEGW
jgi:outer membrane lipopolysaccharide assembly protein LptE/RlpB